MNAEDYLRDAAGRLRDDGSEVSRVAMPGGTALVGYQSRFRIRWLATKVHLFTVLYPTVVATDSQLAALGQDAVSYAKATKGNLRGLQSGVAVIPALIAQTVTEPARAAATARPTKQFAAFLLPAIVDLTSGQTLSYQGPILWGAIYASWLRARLSAALPAPATAITPISGRPDAEILPSAGRKRAHHRRPNRHRPLDVTPGHPPCRQAGSSRPAQGCRPSSPDHNHGPPRSGTSSPRPTPTSLTTPGRRRRAVPTSSAPTTAGNEPKAAKSVT